MLQHVCCVAIIIVLTESRELLHPHLHRVSEGIIPLASSLPGEAWCVGDAELKESASRSGGRSVLNAPLVVQLRLPVASDPLAAVQQALPKATVELLGTGSLLLFQDDTSLVALSSALYSPEMSAIVRRACILPCSMKHMLKQPSVLAMGLAMAQHECLVALSLDQSPVLHEDGGLRLEAVHGGSRMCCLITSGCSVSSSILKKIIEHPRSYFLELLSRPVTHNKFSRGLLESHVEFSEPFSNSSLQGLGLSGAGYVVGVADTGIDADHCFFFDPSHSVPYNALNSNHRKIVRYTTIGSSGNAMSDYVPGHGTHVCGTVAGSSLDPSTDSAAYHGVAYNAKITFTDLSGDNADGIQSPSLSNMFDTARQDGARVHTNSWGSDMASYTSSCREIDSYVAAHDDFTVVFSAGNSADAFCAAEKAENPTCDRKTVSTPSTAKNVISVGATQGTLLSWRAAFLGNYVLSVRDSRTGTEVRFNLTKANFGPKIVAVRDGAPIIQSEDREGCTAPTKPVTGSVVMAQRGTCRFAVKSQLVQSHGAAAVLVVNTIPGDPIVMGCGDEGNTDCGVTIPTFMIGRTEGARITAMLATGTSLTCTISESTAPNGHKNEENLSSFSSHGPTQDFRYKPDLVGVGELVHSAYSDGDLSSKNCDLWATQGTSMAAPMIAGLAVLLHEYFEKGIHVSGVASASNALRASGTLVKAALIHASEPLSGLFDRNSQGDWRQLPPHLSFEQGYGRPVLNSSLPHSADSPMQIDAVNSRSISGGDAHSYCVVYNGKSPSGFKATLVWNDPPSSPLAAFTLINNLDLVVAAGPTGNVFHGNVEEPNTTTSDVLNNVEKIVVRGAEAGAYRVTVLAIHISGAQSYSLLVSGKFAANSSACALPRYGCLHGVVSAAGLCACDNGWTGPECLVPLPTLSSGETATVHVDPAEWRYFRIQPTNAVITITFSVVSLDADADLVVCSGRLPTLQDREASQLPTECTRETTCDNCGSRTHPSTHSLSLQGSSVAFFVGIIGMCCYSTNVTVAVTGNTMLPALATQHLSITQSALVKTTLSITGSNLQDVAEVDLLNPITGRRVATCTATEADVEVVNVVCDLFECSAPLVGSLLRLAIRTTSQAIVAYPDSSVAFASCSESHFPATAATGGTFTIAGLATLDGGRKVVAAFLMLPPTSLTSPTLVELVGSNFSSAAAAVTLEIMSNRTLRRLGLCRIVSREGASVTCEIDSSSVEVGDIFAFSVNGGAPAASPLFAISPLPSLYGARLSEGSLPLRHFERELFLPFLDSRHPLRFALRGRGILPSTWGVFPAPTVWLPLMPQWQIFLDSVVMLLVPLAGESLSCANITFLSDHELCCTAPPFQTTGNYSFAMQYTKSTTVDQAVIVAVEEAPRIVGIMNTVSLPLIAQTTKISSDLSLTIIGAHFPLKEAVMVVAAPVTGSGAIVSADVVFRDAQQLVVSFSRNWSFLNGGDYAVRVSFADYLVSSEPPGTAVSFSFDGLVSTISGLAWDIDNPKSTSTSIRDVVLSPGHDYLYVYGTNLDTIVEPLLLVTNDDSNTTSSGSVTLQCVVVAVTSTKITARLPPFLTGIARLSLYFSRFAYAALASPAPLLLVMKDTSLMTRPVVTVTNVLFVGCTVDVKAPAMNDRSVLFLTNASDCFEATDEGAGIAEVVSHAGTTFRVLPVAETEDTIACLCDEAFHDPLRGVDDCFWRRADLPIIPTAVIRPERLAVSQGAFSLLDDEYVQSSWFRAPETVSLFLHKPFTVNVTLSSFPPFVGANDGTAPFYLYLGFDEGPNHTFCDPTKVIPFGQADVVDDTNTHFGFGEIEVPTMLMNMRTVKMCAGLLTEQMVPQSVDRRIFVPLLVLSAAECVDSEVDCSGHGTCVNGTCQCRDAFRGARCSVACPVNRFGEVCSGFSCDTLGHCDCDDGSNGPACEYRVVRWKNTARNMFSVAAELSLLAGSPETQFVLPDVNGAIAVDILICLLGNNGQATIHLSLNGDGTTQRQILKLDLHSCLSTALSTAGSSSLTIGLSSLANDARLRLAFAYRTTPTPTPSNEILSTGAMTEAGNTPPSVAGTCDTLLSKCGLTFLLLFLFAATATAGLCGVISAVVLGRSIF